MSRSPHQAVLDRRHTTRDWLTCLLAVLIIFFFAGPTWAEGPGTWGSLGSLPSERAGHTATLLADGKVLIAGGKDASGQALASALLYDPATGSYLPAGNMAAAVWGHTATLLPDGTVLLAGGKDSSGQPVAAAQVFDPMTGLFTGLAMSQPRSGHTASLLGDGRVLLAGGTDGSNALGGLEAYDVATKAFVPAGSLIAARQDHTATVLADGRVLFVGGSNGSGALNTAEVFDPKTGTVVQAGALNVARNLASAAPLLNGSVLVVGGQDGAGQDLNSAEIYDPAQNAFTLLPVQMSAARSGHVGLFLENNGKVLIAGGANAGQLVPTVEVYDPVLGVFWQPASPAVARQQFGANLFLVPYAGVLLASGGLDVSNNPLASSEGFFYPTIRSDKPDYVPGDNVFLMGERWQPGETVTINIHESNSDPDINFGVIVDASGAFSVNAFQVNQGDLQQSFITTASGQTSRWTAQTRFTDSANASVTVTATPAMAIGGTFKITRVQGNGNTQTSGGTTTQNFGGIQPNSSFSISTIQTPFGSCTYTGPATVNGTAGAADTTITVTLEYSCEVSTTTSVSSSANPSTYGQSVTFTATVTSIGGTPTGGVDF